MFRLVTLHWSKLLLILVMLVAVLTATTSAIECYECDSSRDGACGHKFHENHAKKCNNGGICRKIINKYRGKQLAYRDTFILLQFASMWSFVDASAGHPDVRPILVCGVWMAAESATFQETSRPCNLS